ncbi:MAG: hypothetical protein H6742_21680 [Alphaproteobacteria bacterium]|nr:hypothetical protein [Alphaproteobacteria bacterium]
MPPVDAQEPAPAAPLRWVGLLPFQLVAVFGAALAQHRAGAGVGIVPALALLFAVTAGVLWFRGQRGGLSPRALPIIKRLGIASGIGHGLVAAAAYALAWRAAPEQFEFGATTLLWAAPAVGAVVGGVAFGITLMAADAVRSVLKLPR